MMNNNTTNKNTNVKGDVNMNNTQMNLFDRIETYVIPERNTIDTTVTATVTKVTEVKGYPALELSVEGNPYLETHTIYGKVEHFLADVAITTGVVATTLNELIGVTIPIHKHVVGGYYKQEVIRTFPEGLYDAVFTKVLVCRELNLVAFIAEIDGVKVASKIFVTTEQSLVRFQKTMSYLAYVLNLPIGSSVADIDTKAGTPIKVQITDKGYVNFAKPITEVVEAPLGDEDEF